MSTDDKRIREFAYQIWESEGKPEGQDARHWEMARKLAEAEALAPKKSPKAAGSKTAGKTTTSKAVEVKATAAKPKATTAKAKPASAAKVIPPGEKATEKKPRAPRKPPAV
ncbi:MULTISPECIES: DUF2934 domain-containing protein [Pseudomonas]|uniref:DUF2934 domain-containing protein n=1 Tax=Pseudomonas fluorescens (strain Pf0-1) TaxID=205922 RepID=Q3KD69_PSEPF|nr:MULTISPECIES: DUF2934 domain-containing protein [Pseudomonas]ABA74286.1 hypothetical protein Pfl01_2545 [Pseudomonas fluorescens Pf0-1]MBL0796218.1 DUF2934 domain-containing protein [Pseudomonas sp. B7]MBX8621558.1 DUF2934 domain-containing protein [Pseudomonas glycinae]MBY9025909.1 DUF2934 domain-containing protein [Pseudomonas fluorescens]MBY9031284.1 DUF2934 domain-containing protein [Pseudomonas fluorescens]